MTSADHAHKFAAVIVAGGVGSRFGEPKHDVVIDGTPVWKMCSDVFAAVGVGQIVVVGDVPGGVAGGFTRRDSVAAGLAAVVSAEWVLVHDAARPLVTVDLVADVIAAAVATTADGVIPTTPVTDTLKKVTDGEVVRTVDRSGLVAVQTPQAFRLSVLVDAHEHVVSEDATDDAGMIEAAGGRVIAIDGDRDNIKITYPRDLGVARAIVRTRGETSG